MLLQLVASSVSVHHRTHWLVEYPWAKKWGQPAARRRQRQTALCCRWSSRWTHLAFSDRQESVKTDDRSFRSHRSRFTGFDILRWLWHLRGTLLKFGLAYLIFWILWGRAIGDGAWQRQVKKAPCSWWCAERSLALISIWYRFQLEIGNSSWIYRSSFSRILLGPALGYFADLAGRH